MSTEPDLIEVLNDAIDRRFTDVHVAIPGTVVSYNRLTQRVNVKPAIKQPRFNDAGELIWSEFDELKNVPVKWPRQGQFAMHSDLVAGDSVELLFHSQGIGEWRTGAPIGEPKDIRRHSFGYPTATVGLYPDTQPLVSPGVGASIGYQGAGHLGRILFTSSTVQIGEGAGVPLALKTDLDLVVAQLKALAAVVATTAAAVGAPPVPANTAAANAVKSAIDALAPPYATVARGV